MYFQLYLPVVDSWDDSFAEFWRGMAEKKLNIIRIEKLWIKILQIN